jgi:transposase
MDKYTVKNFRKQFPDDDTCLEWLKQYLYPNGIHCPKCQRVTKHHKVASRRSYSCDNCGHHVHPTAGTIYHKSSTPLTDWFYAIFLMASTRCGISAKQLERELGVTYKTAWRMFHQIRSMLDDSKNPLGGRVEVDETIVGGRATMARKNENKTIVAGAVERGGRVIAKVVPNQTAETLIPFVRLNVQKNSMIYSDELGSYNSLLSHGYGHRTITHSLGAYVVNDCHTNTIEGFWSLFKGGIRGAYKGRVTKRYLQNYINEFTFRYNRRNEIRPMFLSFLMQTQKVSD